MPEILLARDAPPPPTGDFSALILRTEAVAEDLIATLPMMLPGNPQRTVLSTAWKAIVRAFQTARICPSDFPFPFFDHDAIPSLLFPLTDGYGEINGN